MINSHEAYELEIIIRKVFSCDRFGVMGIANANHLARCPFHAAIAVFAPLYLAHDQIPEIDLFMDKYSCYFTFPDYKYDEYNVKTYIDTLRSLVEKYYC